MRGGGQCGLRQVRKTLRTFHGTKNTPNHGDSTRDFYWQEHRETLQMGLFDRDNLPIEHVLGVALGLVKIYFARHATTDQWGYTDSCAMKRGKSPDDTLHCTSYPAL